MDGNFILNNDGGICIYGHDHLILNNDLEGNTVRASQATLVLNSGCTLEASGLPSGCAASTRVTVAFNTLVNNLRTHLVIGSAREDRPLVPRDVRIENNLIVGEQGTLVEFLRPPQGLTAAGNILWVRAAPGALPSSAYVRVDPRLEVAPDRLLRPAPGSPVIGAARRTAISPLILWDMDGQPRVGALDVGADQVSRSRPPQRPLLPEDVGPNAL